MEENDGYFEWPEEYSRRKLNALYREIPLTDAKSRLLRKYFDAAAELYGIIPLEKLYEIIVSQNRNPVTEDEFRAFSEIAKHERGWYYIFGEHELFSDGKKTDLLKYYLVNAVYMDDGAEEFYDIFEAQQGKPYYIPSKNELLNYADTGYIEMTEQATDMMDFLRKVGMDEPYVEDAYCYILYGIQMMTDEMEDALEFIEGYGARITERDLHTFVKLYADLNNHTRMQCNRGYTPHEMSAMYLPDVPRKLTFGENVKRALADGTLSVDEMRKNILEMELPNEELRFSLLSQLYAATQGAAPVKNKKVGRNDPCPCGSGKKYKHCCGK
ncbi:MAG: SEC-C domain-containing protein [Clostridia bacterium]|nr:SEC-C domain-containing protein [Clostridia bacterium]